MSTESVIIPKAIYDQLIEHGRENLPFEACGILSGTNGVIRSVWPLKNEVKSSKQFFVSKEVVEETMRKIAQNQEVLIAIYHTHPFSKPIPSMYDIAYHIDENVKMVIISFQSSYPITKCYQIKGSHYEECLFWVDLTY